MSTSNTLTTESVQYNGWLHKWTNYIHGYQKRYFIIENDYLSYYRSDAENQSCRGRLKLSSASFHIQSSTMFCITSGTQNYTLKAQNETHRQRWITNLELAKTQARQNKEATRVYSVVLLKCQENTNGQEFKNGQKLLKMTEISLPEPK